MHACASPQQKPHSNTVMMALSVFNCLLLFFKLSGGETSSGQLSGDELPGGETSGGELPSGELSGGEQPSQELSSGAPW